MAIELARVPGETPSDHVGRMAAYIHGLQGRLRKKSDEAESLAVAHDEKEATLDELKERLETCKKLHPFLYTLVQQGLVTVGTYSEERWINGRPVIAITEVAIGLATAIFAGVMGHGQAMDLGMAILNAGASVVNVKASATYGARHKEEDRDKQSAPTPTPADGER